jgi:uncharacterized membrane protein
LPPGHTAIPFLDVRNAEPAQELGDRGPVRRYLPYLNLALAAVLGLLGMVFRGREMVWWGFAWLPGGVYGIILLAKVMMGSVDPEAELGALRYEFKGA